jgi:hypothetical protein
MRRLFAKIRPMSVIASFASDRGERHKTVGEKFAIACIADKIGILPR